MLIDIRKTAGHTAIGPWFSSFGMLSGRQEIELRSVGVGVLNRTTDGHVQRHAEGTRAQLAPSMNGRTIA